MAVRPHRLICELLASRSLRVGFVLALSCALTPVAVAQRLGSEFQVNAYTEDNQRRPSVAVQPSGAFVVVWRSDSSDNGIFARRFSSTGAALATEFLVNTVTVGGHDYPAVEAGPSGEFVVVWRFQYSSGGLTARGGGGYGVVNFLARRFSSAGAPLASEFQVNNTDLPVESNQPPGLADLSGEFIVTWASQNEVFARRFSSAGERLATEFLVNSSGSSPVPASGDSGDFVVVWESYYQGSSDIFGQRFSSTGAFLGSVFQVNSSTAGFQGIPAVSAASSGDFIVVWGSYLDGLLGVFGQRFSSSGTALASEFELNVHTKASSYPSVASEADGDFVVTWESTDGDGSGVFGRSFSRAGVALASEFQVNTYTFSEQRDPQVAAAASGNFVVVWRSLDGPGPYNNYGVFAQRFASPKKIDIDGDGLILPLTDGLLVLRSTFGFTGQVLTTGVVNLAGCTRCDATAIEAYLKTLN